MKNNVIYNASSTSVNNGKFYINNNEIKDVDELKKLNISPLTTKNTICFFSNCLKYEGTLMNRRFANERKLT